MNQNDHKTKQYTLTPAMGKRLIARALLQIQEVKDALENNTIVIIAGTTNSYVAEEFLLNTNQSEDFSKDRFYRGITLPAKYTKVNQKSPQEEKPFLGDVVIVNGKWEKGKTIFDVADQLKTGDLIFKGANAVNLEEKQAAVLIGHPTAGTINPVLQCVMGRRVGLYLPIGLEKRITGSIHKIADQLNATCTTGVRYMPVSGNIVTELDAIRLLCGAQAELFAAGGVCGAEGSCWIAVTGTKEQMDKMDVVFHSIQEEPNYIL